MSNFIPEKDRKGRTTLDFFQIFVKISNSLRKKFHKQMKYIALQKNPNLQLQFNREFRTLMESVPFHREEKDMKGFRLSQTKTKNTFYQQIFKLSTEPTCSKYMIKEMKCSKHLYQKCIMINFFSVLLKWPFDFGNISMCYIIIGQTSRHTMLGICVQLARLNICLCIIPCLHISDVPFAHSSLIVECVL